MCPHPTTRKHCHCSFWSGSGTLGFLLTTAILQLCWEQAVQASPPGGHGPSRPVSPLFAPQRASSSCTGTAAPRRRARGNPCVWRFLLPLLNQGTLPAPASHTPSPGFSFGLQSSRIGEVRFQGPRIALLPSSRAQGGKGTLEMSPSGININKKQMDLCGASYQSTRPQGHSQQTRPRLGRTRLSQATSGQNTSLSPPPPRPLQGSYSPPGLSGENNH